MDKREAIEYLKDRLSEIPKLAQLPYNNDKYPLWRNTIAGILEAVFRCDSSEYQYFASCNWQPPKIRITVADSLYQELIEPRSTGIAIVDEPLNFRSVS